MIAPWVAAACSVVALATALVVHTRVAGWLPEDAPDRARKRHQRPMPMAGFVPAALTAVLLGVDGRGWLAAACVLASAIGTLDDATKARGDGVNWRIKGAVLGLAAVLATVGSGALDQGWPDASGWLVWGTAIAWVFVVTNAFNFLDNTDGVSASLGGFALVWIGGPALPLGAVWLAFVPFNWPRAHVFLGDGGALPLGLVAGALALEAAHLHGTETLDLAAAFAPVAVAWADFAQVVIARLVLGYAPWVADRRHLTHIAQNAGVPGVAVAPLFTALAAAAAWGLSSV